MVLFGGPALAKGVAAGPFQLLPAAVWEPWGQCPLGLGFRSTDLAAGSFNSFI